MNPGEGRPLLFSFCLLWESVHKNARCAGMVLQLTLLGRLQYSTVNQLSSSILDLAFPSISLVLQLEVKSRMAPL